MNDESRRIRSVPSAMRDRASPALRAIARLSFPIADTPQPVKVLTRKSIARWFFADRIVCFYPASMTLASDRFADSRYKEGDRRVRVMPPSLRRGSGLGTV